MLTFVPLGTRSLALENSFQQPSSNSPSTFERSAQPMNNTLIHIVIFGSYEDHTRIFGSYEDHAKISKIATITPTLLLTTGTSVE